MSEIIVQLFGAFRPIGSQMVLQVPADANVQAVRTAFAAKLPEDLHALLAVSRFADEHKVLAEDTAIGDNSVFAILPPVSGG